MPSPPPCGIFWLQRNKKIIVGCCRLRSGLFKDTEETPAPSFTCNTHSLAGAHCSEAVPLETHGHHKKRPCNLVYVPCTSRNGISTQLYP